MAEVQIGLGAVVGDVHFAVLEGTHRAGINVQVGIALLEGDFEAATFQETTDGGGSDPFSQRGNHAAGYKNILRRHPQTSRPKNSFSGCETVSVLPKSRRTPHSTDNAAACQRTPGTKTQVPKKLQLAVHWFFCEGLRPWLRRVVDSPSGTTALSDRSRGRAATRCFFYYLLCDLSSFCEPFLPTRCQQTAALFPVWRARIAK